MFGDKVKPIRRFTPYEYAEEVDDAKHWHRPPRNFWGDTPFYPYLPPAPLVPYVNFDLGYKNKGRH